jgi:PAS domain S-box-containing protein
LHFTAVNPMRSLPAAAARILLLLAGSLAPGSAAAAAPAPAAPPQTIRVVVDNSYAPYSFESDDGKLQGILIDQWRAWEGKTGIKADLHAMSLGEALRRMRAGEFDVIDEIVATDERRAWLDFTPEYVSIEVPIFFRSEISGIADLASLKGFPVGVKEGDQHIDKLRAAGVTALIPFQNFAALIEAAQARKINVFVADAPGVLYVLHKSGIAAGFRRSAPVFRDGLQRAVRKGDASLLHTVSEGFAAIEPGDLKRIDEKWYGSTLDERALDKYGPYLAYAGYAAAFAILLLAALAVWNRTLRKGILLRTAALGESEQRFRQIAENIREVFWMTTPGLEEVLYVSPAYESIWGRSLESLRQRPRSFMDAIHTEDRERVVGILAGRRKDGFEVEYRVVRPDGSVRWIRDRGIPVKDESGKVYRTVGVAEDITGRKQAEEAALQTAQKVQTVAAQTEDHLRLVIDTIPAMAWRVLPDGTVDFVNQRWLDYTGLTRTEAIAQANSIVHPADLPAVLQKWLVDMSAGRSSEDEMRLRRADGEYRWFLVRTVPLFDEQENIVKWYGTSTDIEDRKRADEALRHREFELAEAQRVAQVGSWTFDLASSSVRWSEELHRIFDIEKTDFGNSYESFLSRIHPDDRPRVVRANFEARSHGRAFEVEYRIEVQGGQLKHIREIGYASRDSEGAVSSLFGTAQDVTAQKRAENALRDAASQLLALSHRLVEVQESERKELARELHDRVGQSLTALNINLAILREGLSRHDIGIRLRLDDCAALVESSMHSIGNVLSDLRPQMLDDHGLRPALEWYAKQFATRAEIAVSVRATEPHERMTAETEIALFRIAQEALNNVAKHARAGSVEVMLECRKSEYVMSVTDDGVGLGSFGLESDEKRPGLGMVTMRERAQAVGGKLLVESLLERGTCLTVRIPR